MDDFFNLNLYNMDVFPKFVIIDGKIVFGNVTYHKDLVERNGKPEDVSGGGMFQIDTNHKTITFSGKSEDFGYAYPGEIENAVINDDVYHIYVTGVEDSFTKRGYEIYYQDECGTKIKMGG